MQDNDHGGSSDASSSQVKEESVSASPGTPATGSFLGANANAAGLSLNGNDRSSAQPQIDHATRDRDDVSASGLGDAEEGIAVEVKVASEATSRGISADPPVPNGQHNRPLGIGTTPTLLDPSAPGRNSNLLGARALSANNLTATQSMMFLGPDGLTGAQAQQDAEFVDCESEYLETASTLPAVPSSGSGDAAVASAASSTGLARFAVEYDRLHRAVARTRHRSAVLFRQHQELQVEREANAALTLEASRNGQQEATSVAQLEDQLRRGTEIIEASSRREEAAKAELRALRAELATHATTLKQGVGLSAAQERSIGELEAARDAAAAELDALLERIVRLRASMAAVSERIRQGEQLKRDREREIYELKERNTSKRADIDAEVRNKDRLERELRELRANVSIKSQEVRAKQEAVNRATDEVGVLESQIRSQRQLLEKLQKDREMLLSRKAKSEQDCHDQISESRQLSELIAGLERSVATKDAELTKARAEIRRVHRMRDVLVKKNSDLEERRTEAERERRELKAKLEERMADVDRVNRSIDQLRKSVDDLKREKDILHTKTMVTENETGRHSQAAVLCQQIRQHIELEQSRYKREVEKLHEELGSLEAERDGYIKDAASLQELCVHGLQEIKDKEMEIFEIKKRMIKAETKLKHQQNLYEAVQSDRNLHAKHLVEAQSAIQEMKRKLKIMNFQINGFKEEINAKSEAIESETAEHAKLAKDIEIITDEVRTLRHQNELAQAYVRSQLAEEMRLNAFAKEAEAERLRQEAALQVLVGERDNLGAQLVRQNDELARAYARVRTQRAALAVSAVHYRDRLRAAAAERAAIAELQAELRAAAAEADMAGPAARRARALRGVADAERGRAAALERELQRPVNLHRWRRIECGDPHALDSLRRLQALRRELIARSVAEAERERGIAVQERLYLRLRSVLVRQAGPEAVEQIAEFEKALRARRARLRHLGVELNMYQAQVQEDRHAIARLDKELGAVKQSYISYITGVGRRHEPWATNGSESN
ncbi:hypothetical protein HK405_005363, partial [Cladochytrium tenue]